MNSIKLKEYLLEITKGTTPTTIGGEFLEDGVNFVKAECLNTGRVIDKKSLSYVSIETHKKLSRSILREDDLLFSIAGHLGKMAIVQSSDLPANTNQAVAILRINKSKADVKFLYYYLSSKTLSSFINGQCAQSVQPNINLAQVGELPIVDFPLDYQIKISSVLSSFDSKIELNNKINVELESMAKTLYDYWFVQFDFPDENGKPYKSSGGKMVWNKDLKREIPKVWEVKKVKEIANTGSGSTPIKSKKEYYIWEDPMDK
jgi:type I restriction enzyme S subunit